MFNSLISLSNKINPTILVIDDSELILGLLKVTLDQWDVIAAKSGLAGLGIATKHKPDLVILDWRLGVKDLTTGYETCKALRALYPDLPILLISGVARGDDPAIKEALTLCASRFIEKPFGPIELIETIEELLRIAADEEAE